MGIFVLFIMMVVQMRKFLSIIKLHATLSILILCLPSSYEIINTLLVSALSGVLSARQWRWENTIRQHVAQIPTRSAFGLPCPEDPSSSMLKGIELCLDELPHRLLR